MMTPEQWSQMKEVFHAAAALPPGERQKFVQGRCNGDEEILRELQLLLESHDEAEEFIERPALASASEILSTDGSDFWTGRVIGQYRILHEIGRGGMGTVLLAVRADDQFKKQVAIKVLRRGMDSEDILRRFRNERQILASLEHPFIARLFDGGMTKDGLPYFVMEYIGGQPLNQHAEKQRLAIKARLRLFQKVCEAVQYAHQNLIIHRDLKPSNILITSEGVPKLLDFGIAKVINPDLSVSDRELTRTELRVLTPDYASPEQVRGQRVTTATDVYSLGVVLYELLTGVKPHKIKDTSPEELSRAILKSHPSKPSDAVRDTATRRHEDTVQKEDLPSASASPHLQFSASALKGDIDNIVLMALRKEPQRRYESAAQLSNDIQRYLDGLPVIARKDTFSYRTSKFVLRNRVAVTAACLVFLALLGGVVATAWQARKAREQARIANSKTAEAQAALAKTEKINRFMQSVFAYANPDWFGRARGRRDMSVLEAMRDIEKRIEQDFRDEPDLRSDVYQQIGDSYRTQGLFEDAERNLREALRLRLEVYGEDSAKVAESMYILSGVRYELDDVVEHERLLTKALSIQRRHPEEGNNLPYMTVDYATNVLEQLKNDYTGALALAQEALEMVRRRYGEKHYMVDATKLVVVRILIELGDHRQAEAMIQELRRRQPQDFGVLASYAQMQTVKGDYQAAENAIKQMSPLAQRQDAPAWWILITYHVQSLLAYQRGDCVQSVAYVEKAVAAQPNNRNATFNRALYASPCFNKLGQNKRAEALLVEAIAQLRQSERVVHLARLQSILGETLTAQRRFAEGEVNLLAAYGTEKSRLLPGQQYFVETRRRLKELYRAWGKEYEARKYE